MSSRIVLHVGSPKTGTTFLQQVVWSQRATAEQQGVHLPLGSLHDHFLGSLDVRGLGGKPPHPADSAGAWHRLVDDARRLPGTALVSHELLSAADKEQARKAVGWFGNDVETHVVITARDLLRQVTAEWQEHVKHRNAVTLEDFVGRVRANAEERTSWFWRVQDYPAILDRWAGRLPREHVHVVTVPPAGAASDLLWDRFARLVGLDPAAFDLTASRTNTSLGRAQVEVMRRVNAELGDRLPFPGPYPAVAKDVMAHRILAGRDGQRLAVTQADATFAVEQSQRMADGLDAMGVDVVGSLDELVPDEDAVARVVDPDAYAAVDEGTLLEESIAVIADLLCELSDRTEELRGSSHRSARLREAPLMAALEQVGEDRPAVGQQLEKARAFYRKLRS